MKTKLTHDDIADILANAFWVGYTAFDAVDYDHDEYKEARAKLTEPCIEDIQAQMLLDGKKLMLLSEGKWHDLTLDNLTEAVERYGGLNPDEYDAEDYDAILQLAVFGEIQIG